MARLYALWIPTGWILPNFDGAEKSDTSPHPPVTPAKPRPQRPPRRTAPKAPAFGPNGTLQRENRPSPLHYRDCVEVLKRWPTANDCQVGFGLGKPCTTVSSFAADGRCQFTVAVSMRRCRAPKRPDFGRTELTRAHPVAVVLLHRRTRHSPFTAPGQRPPTQGRPHARPTPGWQPEAANDPSPACHNCGAGRREHNRRHTRRYRRRPRRRRKAVDHHPPVEDRGIVRPSRHGRRVHGNGGDRRPHGCGRGDARRHAGGARGRGGPAPTRRRTTRAPHVDRRGRRGRHAEQQAPNEHDSGRSEAAGGCGARTRRRHGRRAARHGPDAPIVPRRQPFRRGRGHSVHGGRSCSRYRSGSRQEGEGPPPVPWGERPRGRRGGRLNGVHALTALAARKAGRVRACHLRGVWAIPREWPPVDIRRDGGRSSRYGTETAVSMRLRMPQRVPHGLLYARARRHPPVAASVVVPRLCSAADAMRRGVPPVTVAGTRRRWSGSVGRPPPAGGGWPRRYRHAVRGDPRGRIHMAQARRKLFGIDAAAAAWPPRRRMEGGRGHRSCSCSLWCGQSLNVLESIPYSYWKLFLFWRGRQRGGRARPRRRSVTAPP